MDILTKICVVVLVVLILLAVPVFINGAVVGPRYKVWYQQEQTKSKMYAQAAKEAELGCQRVFQELQAEEKRADDIAAERDEKVQELKAQLDAERLNSAELGGKLTSINMQIVDLSASYKQYIERAKLFSERLAAQQKTIDKLTTENMALYNQVKQKTADYERFEQIVKGLHEEISEYKELIADMGRTIEALKVGGGGVMRTPGEAPVFGSDIRISGTIDGVDVANNIASINIGSAKGIRKGMEMIISRGDRLVGVLRIEQVTLNQAAGIIIDKRMDPRQGDKADTRARMLR